MDSSFKVHVLFRFDKKSGSIDTLLTAMGKALLQMWAVQNTPSNKCSMVVERDTGNIVFQVLGKKGAGQSIQKSNANGDMGSIVSYGISLEDLHSIKDDRFDKEEVL